jgi:hypothetical protein
LDYFYLQTNNQDDHFIFIPILFVTIVVLWVKKLKIFKFIQKKDSSFSEEIDAVIFHEMKCIFQYYSWLIWTVFRENAVNGLLEEY